MKIKPCPFCGNMPKISTRMTEYKFGPEVRPFVRAKIRVWISCEYCGLYKDQMTDVFVDCPEEKWLTDRKRRRRAKKMMVEDVLESTWNKRRAE